MSDIINDAEQTYKAMQRLWERAASEAYPALILMRYPRFKVLRSVHSGFKYVPDISVDADINRTTTSELLHNLLIDRLVTKGAIDNRSHCWGITPRGVIVSESLSKVLDDVIESLRAIAKDKMEKWI